MHTLYRPILGPVEKPRLWWKYLIQATILQQRSKRRRVALASIIAANDEIVQELRYEANLLYLKETPLGLRVLTMDGLREEIDFLRQENEMLKIMLEQATTSPLKSKSKSVDTSSIKYEFISQKKEEAVEIVEELKNEEVEDREMDDASSGVDDLLREYYIIDPEQLQTSLSSMTIDSGQALLLAHAEGQASALDLVPAEQPSINHSKSPSKRPSISLSKNPSNYLSKPPSACPSKSPSKTSLPQNKSKQSLTASKSSLPDIMPNVNKLDDETSVKDLEAPQIAVVATAPVKPQPKSVTYRSQLQKRMHRNNLQISIPKEGDPGQTNEGMTGEAETPNAQTQQISRPNYMSPRLHNEVQVAKVPVKKVEELPRISKEERSKRVMRTYQATPFVLRPPTRSPESKTRKKSRSRSPRSPRPAKLTTGHVAKSQQPKTQQEHTVAAVRSTPLIAGPTTSSNSSTTPSDTKRLFAAMPAAPSIDVILTSHAASSANAEVSSITVSEVASKNADKKAANSAVTALPALPTAVLTPGERLAANIIQKARTAGPKNKRQSSAARKVLSPTEKTLLQRYSK